MPAGPSQPCTPGPPGRSVEPADERGGRGRHGGGGQLRERALQGYPQLRGVRGEELPSPDMGTILSCDVMYSHLAKPLALSLVAVVTVLECIMSAGRFAHGRAGLAACSATSLAATARAPSWT